MSRHTAHIRWEYTGGDFRRGQYSREHAWTFDGGVTVPASPSPSAVRAPWSNPANVDPEEAFVAAISSCHMLQFLWLASRAGLVVASYDDEAVGTMTPNAAGNLWVSRVVLAPRIVFGEGSAPDAAVVEDLHHRAHAECFIANSVLTEIVVRAPEDAEAAAAAGHAP